MEQVRIKEIQQKMTAHFYERRKNWDDDIYEMSDIDHFKFWYSKDTGNQYSQRLYSDIEIDEALSTWNEPTD